MSSSDDDEPQLSAHALAALREFYQEHQSKEETETDEAATAMPEENWQLSQFWYDEITADILAREVMAVVGEAGRVACISCPTLYQRLKLTAPPTCTLVLLEYDRRFSKYGADFVFYDYNEPLELPGELKQSFDLVVADPPFLSEECLQKTSQTVQHLAKDKCLLCTGAIMEEKAKNVLNVRKCRFTPHHNRNLGNEFACYVNYNTVVIDKES